MEPMEVREASLPADELLSAELERERECEYECDCLLPSFSCSLARPRPQA
jgi:hypothetical protein